MFANYKSNLFLGLEHAKAEGYKSEFNLKDTYLANQSSIKQYQRYDIMKVQNKRFYRDSIPDDSILLLLFDYKVCNKGYAANSIGIYADQALFDFAIAIHKNISK